MTFSESNSWFSAFASLWEIDIIFAGEYFAADGFSDGEFGVADDGYIDMSGIVIDFDGELVLYFLFLFLWIEPYKDFYWLFTWYLFLWEL